MGRNRTRRNAGHRPAFEHLTRTLLLGATMHAGSQAWAQVAADGAWHVGPGDPTAAPAALDGQVRTMLSDGGTRCYIGGGFGSPGNSITYWDGSRYQLAGLPFWLESAQTNALIRYQGKIHAAGRYPSFGAEAILIRLDHVNGHPVWEPLIMVERDNTNEGLTLAVHDDVLWIGGDFELDDGSRNIATWNGSSAANAGDANGPVRALESHDGRLYAGGDFTNVGAGCPPFIPGCSMGEQHLAVWNGLWSEAFGGTDGSVYALHGVDDGDAMAGLYIGGDFFSVGSSNGHRGMARAEFQGGGYTIDTMDGGVQGTVRTIERWNQGVAVGGDFLSVGQSNAVTAFNVANWSEAEAWESMDLGVEGTVVDLPYGAAVLTLERWATVDAAGLHAGGNFAAYGSSMSHCNFAARFFDLTIIEQTNPFLDDLRNGAFNPIEEFFYELAAESPGVPASLTWGVGNADFQRFAWAADSFEVGERLDLRPLDTRIPDLSVYRPQGPGPFLPTTVLEISPSMDGSAERIRIDCVTTSGERIQSPELFLQDMVSIDLSSLMSSVTVHESEIDEPEVNIGIRVGNPADTLVARFTDGQELFQASDVARFDIRILEAGPFPQDTAGRFEVQLLGDLIVDLAESGFGVGRELHRLGPGTAPEAFDILEASPLDSAAVVYHCEDAGRTFRIEGTTEPDAGPGSNPLYSRRSMTIAAANPWAPFGVMIEDRHDALTGPESVLDLTCFADRIEAHHQFDHPDLRGKVTFMGWDGEIEIDGDLTFEVILDTSTGSGVTVTHDDQSNSTIIDWTEPGLVIFGNNNPLPPIEGPTGMVIGKVEGADGDDTWDVLQRSYMQVTSTMPSSLMVGRTSFTVIEGEPAGDPADLNGDGQVDGADLALVLMMWGVCEGCAADITGNGLVSGGDLALVLAAWDSGQERREARRQR